MAIWRGKRLFRMTNVAENCIAHQSTKAQRPEIMNTALIIQRQTGVAHCAGCDGLVTRLRRTRSFEEIIPSDPNSALPSLAVVPDVILVFTASPADDARVFQCCKSAWPKTRVVLILCQDNVSAHDAVLAPSCFDEVIFCCASELEWKLRVQRILQAQAANDCCNIQKKPRPLPGLPLIGESRGFLTAIDKSASLARAGAAVLITGETGSGKEVFARAIHYQGERQAKPFIPVNCGALPDHLFENELFGHAKGAFTDASSAENGLVAEAEGGSLFLDEIDALSGAAQVKLLRFLQNGEYRPLGSARSLFADVRVLAATNADLKERVRLKQFREDLFYRLNVLTVAVPPLRERDDDVLRLAEHFIELYAARAGVGAPRLSAVARQKLLDYSWPGNVRELDGVIQRAVLLNTSGTLHAVDIDLADGEPDQMLARQSLRWAKSLVIGEFERGYVSNLLAAHKGNISQAAKAAGKDRRTLQRLVRKYSLKRESYKI
jgi:DNA-binding NtrC family response regulator